MTEQAVALPRRGAAIAHVPEPQLLRFSAALDVLLAHVLESVLFAAAVVQSMYLLVAFSIVSIVVLFLFSWPWQEV